MAPKQPVRVEQREPEPPEPVDVYVNNGDGTRTLLNRVTPTESYRLHVAELPDGSIRIDESTDLITGRHEVLHEPDAHSRRTDLSQELFGMAPTFLSLDQREFLDLQHARREATTVTTTTDPHTDPSLRQRAEWEARKALVRRDPDRYTYADLSGNVLGNRYQADLEREVDRVLADWAPPEVTPNGVEPVPTTSGYQHPFPVARLYRGRTLHLNVPAVQLIRAEHGGTVPDHARVLIDRSQSLIVLELTREPGPSTARVGHRLSDNGQYVVGVRHAVHLLVGDPPTHRRHEVLPAAEVARIRAEWDTAAADRYLNEWEHDLANYPGHGRYRLLRTPTGYAVRLTDPKLP